jgi:NAD(P)-dependent dehydrogenase (short-subunit alcohol dehydrogenase family)
MKCDLTKEDEILSMFGRIQSELGGVDVCINNAGLSHCAPLLSGSTADWRNMLDVSVLLVAVIILYNISIWCLSLRDGRYIIHC